MLTSGYFQISLPLLFSLFSPFLLTRLNIASVSRAPAAPIFHQVCLFQRERGLKENLLTPANCCYSTHFIDFLLFSFSCVAHSFLKRGESRLVPPTSRISRGSDEGTNKGLHLKHCAATHCSEGPANCWWKVHLARNEIRFYSFLGFLGESVSPSNAMKESNLKHFFVRFLVCTACSK